MGKSVQISVVIITFNEEDNLSRCVKSVAGIADEVLVMDSHSTDRTVDLAKELGCRVILQPFLGHREQKALAIERAKYDYVLSLDADEALSEELRESVLKARADWSFDGHYVNRLNRIGGQWIHHGGWYPDRKMRLFDRRRYQMGGTNPHDRFDPVPGAKTTRLRGDLLHYTNDDLDARIETINKFSRLAALAYFDRGKRGGWLRVWLKPPGRFLSEYVLRGGWRDGFYGYFVARTSAQYVWLREMKLWELSRRKHSGDSAEEKAS